MADPLLEWLGQISLFEKLGTTCFALAVLHTFSVKRFQSLALRHPEGSVLENLYHLLGEVEVVFGLWAGVLVFFLMAIQGKSTTISYLESLNFTEPLFVFVVMVIASTKPVLWLATTLLNRLSGVLPLSSHRSFYLSTLILGPLLGSFITEPAAMTVTALVLKDRFFDSPYSLKFKYATLAVLFVNISIGGVLTAFAAPPVLMVAAKWQWTNAFMLTHFGWKAVLAVLGNVLLVMGIFWREFDKIPTGKVSQDIVKSPFWLVGLHLFFLMLVVGASHHPIFFIGIFLFFLGVVGISAEYQTELKLKESLLVGFFLGGLVVLGTFQAWWLKPLLLQWSPKALFLGSTFLTGFVDNAALTYLGSQVPGISAETQFALVAGAVSGGGLTVIANAPNPAGYSILRNSFGREGISPLFLLVSALFPTLLAMACFWFLPAW